MKEIKVPVLPESITEATVAAWHKKPGDYVELDDVIVEIETDKVVLEVPAEESGVLSEITAEEGETVSEQQVLGLIDDEADPGDSKYSISMLSEWLRMLGGRSYGGSPLGSSPQVQLYVPVPYVLVDINSCHSIFFRFILRLYVRIINHEQSIGPASVR